MWNYAASSSDGCQFVYTERRLTGTEACVFTGFWVVFWSRFVSVWRLDSGELLMSADRVRHGVMESKGPFVAISKQPTYPHSGANIPTSSLPISLSNFPFNSCHSFSSPSLASEEPPVWNSQKRPASKINMQTGTTPTPPPQVSHSVHLGMRLFY